MQKNGSKMGKNGSELGWPGKIWGPKRRFLHYWQIWGYFWSFGFWYPVPPPVKFQPGGSPWGSLSEAIDLAPATEPLRHRCGECGGCAVLGWPGPRCRPRCPTWRTRGPTPVAAGRSLAFPPSCWSTGSLPVFGHLDCGRWQYVCCKSIPMTAPSRMQGWT